jgi:hypothetical protein
LVLRTDKLLVEGLPTPWSAAQTLFVDEWS